MRVTTATLLAMAYATAVLASPMKRLKIRQDDDGNGDDDADDGGSGRGSNVSDDDSDDAVLYSPANLTTLNPGSTFNFTYLCDDDDCSSVRVALIQYIEVRLLCCPSVAFGVLKRFSCTRRSPLAFPLPRATVVE